MKHISPKKNNILVLCLIVILALGIRSGIIAVLPNISLGGAQVYHAELARNLVAGRGFVIDEEYFNSILEITEAQGYIPDIESIKPPEHEVFTNAYGMPPGTSLLLAATYWAFSEHQFIYLRILQAIIDSFGCVFLFLIGKELFSTRIGLISGFLYAIWIPIAYISTWPLQDALMPFITLVCFYFFVLGVRKRKVRFYIISGLIAGVGCYFQPSLLLLPIILGIGLFIYEWRKISVRENIVIFTKTTLVMMVMLLIVITPWTIYNYNVSNKKYIGIREVPWQGIWEGFGEVDNPFGAVLDDAVTHQQIKEELGYDPGSFTPEAQAIFKEKVLNAIKGQPGWWVSTVLRRIPRSFIYFDQIQLRRLPTPDNTPWYAEKRWISFVLGTEFVSAFKNGMFSELARHDPFLVLYLPASWFFAVIPVLLSIVGIWVMRRKWRELVLVLTLPVYFSLFHIFLFVSFHKSLLPGSLAYIILCAIALDYFYCRIKDKGISDIEYSDTRAPR